MTVRPSKDIKRLAEILNDPDVYPWVHGTIVGPLDPTSVVNNKNATILLGEHGGMVFYMCQPGLYDFHTFVLKSGRGDWALKMAEDAFWWVFTRTDAMELLGRVPYGNIAAKAFAKRMRGVFEYKVEKGWIFDHKIVPADIYSFKIQDWMRDAPGMIEVGQWFHKKLDSEYKALGFARKDPHPEDELHDRYVGATVEIVRGGQPYKAAVLYNRWAAMTGYQPIQVLTDKPAVLDITESLLVFKGNDFKVVSCRSE